MKNIDITFDARTDSHGEDPDSASTTLKHYHEILWSKILPNGHEFNLDDKTKNAYLYHKSDLGEYYLSSDSMIHTYFKWKRMQNVIKQIPEDEMRCFYDPVHTIGGYIIFPANKVNGLYTINQERGINTKINDRIDLTLECLRLYYNNEGSPLFHTIKRYDNYFKLFDNFKGYCDYFLMQDLVSSDYSKIKFFLPFDGFISNPLPRNVDEYNIYKNNNLEFLNKRNKRIENYNIENS
jgi:hypothetical protein